MPNALYSTRLCRSQFPRRLVVIRVRRIRQIKHHRRMRLPTPAVRKRRREIDAAVEMEPSIRIDVNVQALVVRRRVENANLARLHKVIRHDDVLLVRRHLDVMRSHRRLHLVRIVESLHVVEVRNVQRRNVVGRRDRH